MTVAIIITFCVLLLIAYIFDLTSAKTKIPSVILLLLLGWSVKQLIYYLGIQLPDFSEVLPGLGTLGLILIVLEGSLELEFNKSKLVLIRKSFFGALISMLALAFLLAFLFNYFGNFGWKDSLINAVPFCVISSAIAIPSVRYLAPHLKEFVIYESSLSDILAVLIFNFLVLNTTIDLHAFGAFSLQMVIIIIVSFIATIGLSFFLSKIEHHIKFVPIILIVILLYEVSKIFHLPGLVFILLFGLFIGNLDELKHIKWIEKFKPEELNKEVQKFKELTVEAAFLIRSLFFLLFGFLIETEEVLNKETLFWAGLIVAAVFAFRAVQLLVSRLPILPLIFIAPRGLITILLFVSIVPNQHIWIVNKSLVIQVILITAVIMMVGLITTKSPKIEEADEQIVEEIEG